MSLFLEGHDLEEPSMTIDGIDASCDESDIPLDTSLEENEETISDGIICVLVYNLYTDYSTQKQNFSTVVLTLNKSVPCLL